mgnify:FL=1|tara:strand:+ start:566 stop:805 length:240 start_codon:yes stop_codon:yes gene_type:complete
MRPERYDNIRKRAELIIETCGLSVRKVSQEVVGDFRESDTYVLIRTTDDTDWGKGDLAWCVEEALRLWLQGTIRGRYNL